MCPDHYCMYACNKQRGFLLPLALFILVVMGALALTISRTATQTNASSIQEFTNVQAFYAAESGAQRGMQHLFLNADIARASVNVRCNNWSQTYSFTGNGLKSCSANVSCNFTIDGDPAIAGDDTRSFYTITSIGSCGSGIYRAERTVEVGSYLEQE